LPLPHLGEAGQRALAAAIVEADPDGEFVKLDVDTRQVTYTSRIKQHENIRDYVGEEEPVRAYLVTWLCTDGLYPPEALELERSYEYGRAGLAQLDIRISQPDSSDRAFALIEVKAPGDWGGADDPRIKGQLFALTAADPETLVLSLVTVQVGSEGIPSLTTVTIDYNPALTFDRWVKGGRPSIQDFPVNYQEPTQVPYAPGTERDLRTDLTRPQLDRIRRELHNKLWGGSRDDNQIYDWLVRLFLTKILDEKVTDINQPYRFQVFHEGVAKSRPRLLLNESASVIRKRTSVM
jgi:type I restriction enzyme M protein